MITPVIFHWSGPDNRRFKGEGATRDMSVAGVFVFTPTCPPVNSIVHMEVILPISDGGSKAQMKAEMMITRVDHNDGGGGRSGFSAVSDGFSLRTHSERASRVVTELIHESQANEGEVEGA